MSGTTGRILGAIALASLITSTSISGEALADSRRVQLGLVSPKISVQSRRVLATPNKFNRTQVITAVRERSTADRNQRILVDRLRNN